MATREEIEVGLKGIKLSEWSYGGKTNHPHFLSPDDVEQVMQYLHENGVVIKVDRELPEIDTSSHTPYYCSLGEGAMRDKMVAASFVATEPLIKERRETLTK